MVEVLPQIEKNIFYSCAQENDQKYLESLLSKYAIKSSELPRQESMISYIESRQPTHVILDFSATISILPQLVMLFSGRCELCTLVFFKTAQTATFFNIARETYCSHNVFFVDNLSNKYLGDLIATPSLNRDTLKGREGLLSSSVHDFDNEFKAKIFQKSLKNLKISNNFMIDREKLDLLSERSRHWHSLLGAVRLFGDTDLEVELEVLNNEAQNINSIYIEMEQRMQDHYAHTLQFIHNLYTRDHANKES